MALAAALLCLPFLGAYPLFDPDEGYYPAAAAESLREGHPLDLTLNGEPRWNKPPLSYALMQVSMTVLGENEFAVRLPSVLEGLVPYHSREKMHKTRGKPVARPKVAQAVAL